MASLRSRVQTSSRISSDKSRFTSIIIDSMSRKRDPKPEGVPWVTIATSTAVRVRPCEWRAAAVVAADQTTDHREWDHREWTTECVRQTIVWVVILGPEISTTRAAAEEWVDRVVPEGLEVAAREVITATIHSITTTTTVSRVNTHLNRVYQ
ncbi:unnamed protein product [Medioppia subpectinata]|uniref:Uncharacterized protein n=1 Tax=Medioppia subpectinata TaxID=1979941 RepID=A0A7R9QLF2_9ACAR|nr:unnamed protein product [Medioppia subpectinata]CAG2122310.1 unnamed protein product [Medioppia subpectinata]